MEREEIELVTTTAITQRDGTEALVTIDTELVEQVRVLLTKYDSYAEVTNQEQLAGANECAAQAKRIKSTLDKRRLAETAAARAEQKDVNELYGDVISQLQPAIDVPNQAAKAYMKAEAEREEAERQEALQRAREAEERAEAERKAAAEKAAKLQAEAEEKAAKAARAIIPGKRKKLMEAAERDAAAAAGILQAGAAVAEAADQEAAQERMTLAAPGSARSSAGTLGSRATLKANWTFEVTDIDAVPEEWLRPPEERVDRVKLGKLAKSMHDGVKIPGIRFFNDPTLEHRSKVR